MAKFLANKNGNGMKKCAFCKYFYDPTNSVIAPKRGQRDVWEYETNVKRPCLKKNNMEVCSHSTCPGCEIKL